VDQYPYTAVGGSIQESLLPSWALEGSHDDVLTRLKDTALRARIKAAASRTIRFGSTRGDLRRVALANCPWDRSLAGKTLADIALMRFNKVTVDAGVEAGLWLVEQGGCARVLRDALSEQDVERILKHSATMIASDGGVPVGVGTERGGMPHPRSYGTFPRVLSVYVRERKLLSLEEAVRKMTSFPARRLKLVDRGLIGEGMKADLVVFDPATVRDTATFENPHQYPDGIPIVIVNGEVVFENGAMTAARPGGVLYGPAALARSP
jgi:N-acyl-D-amino-acid deacylase